VIPLPVTDTGTSSYKVIPYYSSKIISSYPYNTDTNTNSYTKSNSDTNTNHHHHSKIISSYPYNTDTNTNHYNSNTNPGRYHSHKDVSSNDYTSITSGGMDLNLGMGNLAQKIINDVKSKFESNWVQFP
jgi:hypothetical protein